MDDILAGIIRAYSPRTNTVRIDLAGADVRVGDKLLIKDADDWFVEDVESLQVDDEYRDEARAGESLALRVSRPVHAQAHVYLVRGLPP